MMSTDLDLEDKILELWKREMPHYPIEDLTALDDTRILLNFSTYDASGLVSLNEAEKIIENLKRIAKEVEAEKVYFSKGDLFSVVFLVSK